VVIETIRLVAVSSLWGGGIAYRKFWLSKKIVRKFCQKILVQNAKFGVE